MNGDRNAGSWEQDYSRRGRVWGGTVHHLPPLDEGTRVLELGCGNGKTFSALAEKKCDVVGIDFSSSAAILCRSLSPKNEYGEIALSDVSYLPFRDASFDCVIAFHVIGHLPESGRIRCALESVRVLRTGGHLYFSGFSTEDFRAGTGNETEPGTFVRKNGIATHYFTGVEVNELFCTLQTCECITRRWTMTVRGQLFPRAEIAATFKKIF
jgi:ubiquinone/menaquinone biosynthesis C-methylase UbiE